MGSVCRGDLGFLAEVARHARCKGLLPGTSLFEVVSVDGVMDMSLMARGRDLEDMNHAGVGEEKSVWNSCLIRRLIDLRVSGAGM